MLGTAARVSEVRRGEEDRAVGSYGLRTGNAEPPFAEKRPDNWLNQQNPRQRKKAGP